MRKFCEIETWMLHWGRRVYHVLRLSLCEDDDDDGPDPNDTPFCSTPLEDRQLQPEPKSPFRDMMPPSMLY